MTTTDTAAGGELHATGFNLHLVRRFFGARECAEIVEVLRRASAGSATIYGAGASGSVDERVRKAARLAPPAEVVGLVVRRLSECRAEIAARYGLALTRCEEPQFLRYRAGDYFVAHQDGNTGLIRSGREQSRKVSAVIFLNRHGEADEPDTYGGGSLTFSEWRAGRTPARFELRADAGTLVAFPAETTHEVLPVTRGERFSIVSWFG
jgi:SM-20-related protein